MDLRPHLRDVIVGTAGAVVAAAIIGLASSFFDSREETKKVEAAKISVANECGRLKKRFDNLYNRYPTITCKINVYQLPKFDRSLTLMVNSYRAELIADDVEATRKMLTKIGNVGDYYDQIYKQGSSRAGTVGRGTATVNRYMSSLNDVCSWVSIEVKLPKCPYR